MVRKIRGGANYASKYGIFILNFRLSDYGWDQTRNNFCINCYNIARVANLAVECVVFGRSGFHKSARPATLPKVDQRLP
jgi:hypothetical protein